MSIKSTFVAAALTFIGLFAIAGCSEDQPAAGVVSEAYAATATQPDFGWRTPASPSAVPDGNVYEYQ